MITYVPAITNGLMGC